MGTAWSSPGGRLLRLDHVRVEPRVQICAPIQHAVAEASIAGPCPVAAPVRQRPVGRDHAQGGVIRTVITLGVEPVKQHAQSLTDREGFVVLGISWKWTARFVGVRRVAQPFGFRPHRSERAGFVRDAGKGNRCRSSACAWSSKRGASAMTPLSFATAFPFHRDRRPGAVRRRIRLTRLQTAEVTCCIRGSLRRGPSSRTAPSGRYATPTTPDAGFGLARTHMRSPESRPRRWR